MCIADNFDKLAAGVRTLRDLCELATAHAAKKAAVAAAEKERLMAEAAELRRRIEAACSANVEAERRRVLAEIAAAATPDTPVRMPDATDAHPLRVYTMRCRGLFNMDCNSCTQFSCLRPYNRTTSFDETSFQMYVAGHYYDAVLCAIAACRARFPAASVL